MNTGIIHKFFSITQDYSCNLSNNIANYRNLSLNSKIAFTTGEDKISIAAGNFLF